MIGALWIFWLLDHVSEGYQWVTQALSQEQTVAMATWTRAKALFTASLLAHYRGDMLQQLAYGEAYLELMRAEGNARGVGIALNLLGHFALEAGDYDTLTRVAQESLPLLRGLSDRWQLAQALYLSAYSCHWLGEPVRARILAEESLALFELVGEPHLMMHALYALTCTGGGYAALCLAYQEICKSALELENITTLVACLLGIGAILAAQGQFEPAVRLWGKAKALYDPINAPLSEQKAEAWVGLALRIHLGHDQMLVRVRIQLDEHVFTAAWNEGQKMTLAQLLDAQTTSSFSQKPLTESSPSPSVQPGAFPVKLTQREQEVLRLLAEGLTSAQIAKRLVIGLVTVNSHVHSIYSKLGVSSRSAATRYAMEHHLL